MGTVGTLVAEVPIQIENPFHATDNAALQEEFRRDSQIQVHIEGIHMGDERTCRGPALLGLQDRGLHLEVAAPGQGGAQAGHRRDPLPGDLSGLLAA